MVIKLDKLGYYNDQVDEFYFRALAATCDENLTVEDLIHGL